MSTEHLKLRELFISACDLPANEQQALIEARCADDPVLRDRLLELLRNDAKQDDALADGQVTAGMQLQLDTVVETAAPQCIGRYRIKKILGQGGMGVVYLAEQENPQRDVALKVIRSGLMNRELIRRFELEAAVLGRLQHPGIAKIHEAGMFDDGAERRPFFAMDFVDGQSLMEYVNQNQPDIHQRLKMFVQICEAVQHAHQRGIIHRDLKPANVQVSRDGQTHILDFGVARATETDLQVSTLQTSVGQLVGTLPYMSPEQITGRGDELDTRSDVYSLGVLLYELLSGNHPHELGDRSIPDAIRKILQEPPRPISANNRILRGDIETIVQKALAKDKKLRYQSASELAADIQRYLNQMPIEARPASTWYQLRRFSQRHKALVSSAAIVLATLIVATILVANYAYQQAMALDEANRQNLIKEEVNRFLNEDLLGRTNPYEVQTDMTVRKLLDAASEKIADRFAGMPEVEAEIRHTIGWSYLRLGEYVLAEQHLDQARQLYALVEGPESPKTIEYTIDLITCLLENWKLDLAEEHCLAILADAESVHKESQFLLGSCYERYAMLLKLRGKPADAESYYRDALALWDQIEHADQRLIRKKKNSARHNLAVALKLQKKFDEAETLMREVLTEKEAIFGDHPMTWTGRYELASLLWQFSKSKQINDDQRAQKVDEAEQIFDEILAKRRDTFGGKHPDTLSAYHSTALIKMGRKEYAAAAQMFANAVAVAREIHQPEPHMSMANSLAGWGICLVNLGQAEEAASHFEQAFAIAMELVGSNHRKTKGYLNNFLHCHEVHTKNDAPVQMFYDRNRNEMSLAQECLVLRVLASLMAHNSKLDQAIQVQSDICDRILDSDLPKKEIAKSFDRLAEYLEQDGQPQAANAARLVAENQ